MICRIVVYLHHKTITKIKKIVILSLFALTAVLFVSCNSKIVTDYQIKRHNESYKLQEERTAKLLEKAHTEVDTVYLYHRSFTEYYYVWYHKDNYIHKFAVSAHKTKEYKPIEAQNFTIEEENIGKYFQSGEQVGSPYFDFWLSDAEMLRLCVKDQKHLDTGFCTDRLFNDKLAKGTLAYKLQYDLWKMKMDCVPKEFDFNKMYAE